MKTGLLEKYASVLSGLSSPLVRDPRLLMDASGDIKIYYAPFEYINPRARIVLVGITPGSTQMINANTEAARSLQVGKSTVEAIQAANSVGAFSGEPLRSNLVKQLNHWGFQKWLGLTIQPTFSLPPDTYCIRPLSSAIRCSSRTRATVAPLI